MSVTTNKSMLLVKGIGQDMQPTFGLIPINLECPYMECVFMPSNNSLAIISKERKQTFHFFPKINDNGDYMRAANRPQGKEFKEERKSIEAFYEYYVSDKQDVETIVKTFAVNADTFDWKSFFKAPETVAPVEGVAPEHLSGPTAEESKKKPRKPRAETAN